MLVGSLKLHVSFAKESYKRDDILQKRPRIVDAHSSRIGIRQWYLQLWLRLVGSLKLQVLFAKKPYKREYILQKRPMILKCLLIVATLYLQLPLTGTLISFKSDKTLRGLWNLFQKIRDSKGILTSFKRDQILRGRSSNLFQKY